MALATPISTVIVIANALLLGAIIVGVIYRHPDTFQWILFLAGLWIFRSVFNSTFEQWCSVKASEIKCELRAETTSTLGDIDPLAPSELSALLIKGSNSLDIYQTLLLNYLEKGMEEYSTMKYRKKKTSMFIEDYYVSIEVMQYDNKERIRAEIKYVNQIISSYEKFRGTN